MGSETRSPEQRILAVMRKVLANVVKDTTPPRGMRHPLSERTIEDIRHCFALISAREQELARQAGIEVKERPRFGDEPHQSKVVPISQIGRTKPGDEED
jgi:hypothetical protein